MKSKNNLLYSIGVDLGGTNIKAAICRSDGKIFRVLSLPTEADRGPAHVVAQIHSAIERLLSKKNFLAPITGIGVGAPGSIDHEKGLVLHPPNLPGWKKVKLAQELSKRWNLRVNIENDANAAALGEAYFGSGKNRAHFIAITIGTGIGSGIILDGNIFHGEKGFAGELGHISIDYNGPKCNCGKRGCIEAYVGNSYLIAKALDERSSHPDSLLNRKAFGKTQRAANREMSVRDISLAAKRGDVFATHVLYRAGEYLGMALGNAAVLLDVTTFIIGGGIAAAGKPLFDGINASIRRNVIKPMRARIEILPAQLGNNAGVLGAASLFF